MFVPIAWPILIIVLPSDKKESPMYEENNEIESS